MTIKELAYSTQKSLHANTGCSIKRAHVYELLASSFDFKSYAAFNVEHVFGHFRKHGSPVLPKTEHVVQRCIDLGYQRDAADLAAATLIAFLTENKIGVVSISSLINSLRGELRMLDDYFEDTEEELFGFDDPDRTGPLLLDSLEMAASKGNAKAHYALALIYAPNGDHRQIGMGSSYWFEQAQSGRILVGVEKEWAEAYEARLNQTKKYEYHLREAGRQNYPMALLDLAESFGDTTFFDQSCPDIDVDPAEIAEIAEQIGHDQGAKYRLTVSAENGDTNAMLKLLEAYDSDNLVRCWTWVYLSRLVGTDLTKDEYYAFHEDGSLYDDDIGGPMLVDGRDGVTLDPISPEQDAEAKLAAQNLYESISLPEH
ncbi:hypothetical protein [Microbulbifer sp. YPW1]|uniref:hypothetical protein n=1 Tax=Microbulbifer sp. YPW1 TaxID=2745199 RepID=UPI00159B648D|nr:hypothetical protein [Microbulbifer sp. YPW1]QKX16903.1 hypothetical protein HUW35_07760 [Microbulbifer sp. YPW1]